MENSKNSKLDPSNQFRGILNTHFLRPTSKHLYIIKLTKLMNITGMNMDEIIHSPEEITNLVEDMDITDSTRVSFISSIMAYFIYNNDNLKEKEFDLFQKWNEIKAKFSESIKKRYIEHRPTTKQRLAFMDYDELQKIKEQLPFGQERLLMTLYLDLPPVRADYFNCQLKDTDDGDGNYIIFDDELGNDISGLLILNDYKTSKKYSRIEIPIPTKVMNDILECLKDRKTFDNEYSNYLFLTHTYKKYRTRQSWTIYANNTLKTLLDNPNFSLTMFRHIYISRPELGFNVGKTTKEREELSKKMGHSTQMQIQYQWRN